MTWLSVNPENHEEWKIIDAAMALSGNEDYMYLKQNDEGDIVYEPPDPWNLDPKEVAKLYNNADALGLNIYRVREL